MLLPLLARWRAPERPSGVLPAPGPHPVAQPPWRSIVILVVIIVTVVWLLAQGYSIDATLEAVGGAAALATALVSCLAGTPSAVPLPVVK